MSSTLLFDSLDEAVVEVGSVGLAVCSGVVALSDEDWLELDAGAEVAAGFAG